MVAWRALFRDGSGKNLDVSARRSAWWNFSKLGGLLLPEDRPIKVGSDEELGMIATRVWARGRVGLSHGKSTLEVCAVYVRKGIADRGHVFVVMLAI